MMYACVSIFLVAVAVLFYCGHVLFQIRKAQREILFLHLLHYRNRGEDAPWVSTALLFDDLDRFMSLGQIYILLDELEANNWVETETRWVQFRPRRFARAIRKPDEIY